MANPLGVGAISPSSQALAVAMTANLTPEVGRVLELGSGTGVFARHLVSRGFDPAQLVLVEQDPRLAQTLQRGLPGATVLQVPAQELDAHHPVLVGITAVICGLPLRNMSQALQRQILAALARVMAGEGVVYLFTYGLGCPIAPDLLTSCGWSAVRIQLVWRNLPPASVYRLDRRVPALRESV